ncbi:hypothetical protein MBLNU230_g7908t1 [Neophaeotheca triangularis]
MPRSLASHYSLTPSLEYTDEDDESNDLHDAESLAAHNAYRNRYQSRTVPTSPVETRRTASTRASDLDLRSRMPLRLPLDETDGLLAHAEGLTDYRAASSTAPGTPRHRFSRQHSYDGRSVRRNHSRHGSLGLRLARALGTDPNETDPGGPPPPSARPSIYFDDRVWYDQFTSTDWVHDSIADAYRVKELRSRKDFRGRLSAFFDGAQGWILVAIIGCVTAGFAYMIDISESTIFDFKTGYCKKSWWYNKKRCCDGASVCDDWARWSGVAHVEGNQRLWSDFVVYVGWVVLLATLACLVTLQTKTTISSAISLSTLDENLGAEHHRRTDSAHLERKSSPSRRYEEASKRPPTTYYPAAASGVAEVKVILSGYIIHQFLGLRTLVCKTIGLVLSVASGLSIGKEGPYVHIATCIGNIACRLFSKYNHNDGKRREVLAASAASGVAVAFGAPIGGVLFSLEEVSYYFPPKTLFRTFFCCIVSALSLRFLNPYGTGKIVLFEVRYLVDWKLFEIVVFAFLGVLGGATGAFFIKASGLWARTFRKMPVIKKYPIVEVMIVALVTGILSFWNRYTRAPVAELLYELAAPCDAFTDVGVGLCPAEERIPEVIWYLCVAFVIKAFLTTVAFGIKVPAGIYVPSMVVGGLLGRIVGHAVQYITLRYPDFGLFASCPADGNPESCVVPGVYALVAAGATMCGVTRLSVTLAVILLELTGSLEHVLPFSLGVLIAKWTADAIEPYSIYDLLLDMNSYPYLDSKERPVFTTDLGDITPKPNHHRTIDISSSPLVPARELRSKLEYLHMAGELDGGLPILRDGILAGLIPAPDLEYALDNLGAAEEGALCLMSPGSQWQGPGTGVAGGNSHATTSQPPALDASIDVDGANEASSPQQPLDKDPTDFTPYIDPAPVALDICSPMDLVFECFVKLGLRYICVLREGRFAGMVHKKAFVRVVKDAHKGGVGH